IRPASARYPPSSSTSPPTLSNHAGSPALAHRTPAASISVAKAILRKHIDDHSGQQQAMEREGQHADALNEAQQEMNAQNSADACNNDANDHRAPIDGERGAEHLECLVRAGERGARYREQERKTGGRLGGEAYPKPRGACVRRD